MMRMWMVPPRVLCDRHLLAEHFELHVFEKELAHPTRSLAGFYTNGTLSPGDVPARHAVIVQEMEFRGFHHRSPLKFEEQGGAWPWHAYCVVIPIARNLAILRDRCEYCKRRQDRAVSTKVDAGCRDASMTGRRK